MAKNVFSYCERHNVVSYCFHGKEDILSEMKKERVKYIRDSEKKLLPVDGRRKTEGTTKGPRRPRNVCTSIQ